MGTAWAETRAEFWQHVYYEQLLSRLKHRKSNISSKISGKHLENSLRIATTDIEPDIDVLFSQKKVKHATSSVSLLPLILFV